jgi:hypothetical protein
MVHAALLLLMLEAAQRGPRFTISLKRSTQSSAINKNAGPITPSLSLLATKERTCLHISNVQILLQKSVEDCREQ